MIHWRWVQEGRGSCTKCSASELERKLRHWTWRKYERGKDLQLVCLVPQSVWPVGSQVVPVGIGTWNKALGRQNEVRKGSYIESTRDGAGSGGKLQEVFCCRAEDESG